MFLVGFSWRRKKILAFKKKSELIFENLFFTCFTQTWQQKIKNAYFCVKNWTNERNQILLFWVLNFPIILLVLF